MTTERILTLKITSWRKIYFNSKRAVVSIFVLIAIIFCLDLPILFNELPYNDNNTNLTIYEMFFSTQLVDVYEMVSFI